MSPWSGVKGRKMPCKTGCPSVAANEADGFSADGLGNAGI